MYAHEVLFWWRNVKYTEVNNKNKYYYLTIIIIKLTAVFFDCNTDSQIELLITRNLNMFYKLRLECNHNLGEI